MLAMGGLALGQAVQSSGLLLSISTVSQLAGWQEAVCSHRCVCVHTSQELWVFDNRLRSLTPWLCVAAHPT